MYFVVIMKQLEMSMMKHKNEELQKFLIYSLILSGFGKNRLKTRNNAV